MVTLRPAEDADVDTLHMIARVAYEHYVARIGRPPAPMTADYAHAVRSRQAWVAVEHGEIVGLAAAHSAAAIYGITCCVIDASSCQSPGWASSATTKPVLRKASP